MSKKLLKFVDKISKSRYFQQATDYRYIKKAMEEVSNTRLVLNVEMKAVNGTLAVNIPPPPTNRIWYVDYSTADYLFISFGVAEFKNGSGFLRLALVHEIMDAIWFLIPFSLFDTE